MSGDQDLGTVVLGLGGSAVKDLGSRTWGQAGSNRKKQSTSKPIAACLGKGLWERAFGKGIWQGLLRRGFWKGLWERAFGKGFLDLDLGLNPGTAVTPLVAH